MQTVTTPVGSLGLLAADTSGRSGWLYHLLVRSGVDPSTASSVTDFVIRPIEILITIVVAALVAHYGARAIRRVLTRMAAQATKRSGSPRAEGRVATVVALVTNLWRFFVVIVAISIILGIVGVNLTPILASATIIGATIGFGAQSLVRDYLSGILLTMEDQFGIGDTISVNDTSGVVEDISLRITRLRAADGTVWHLPNGDIRRIGNTTRGWAKAIVDVQIAPGDPELLAHASEVAGNAARAVAHDPRFAAHCTEPPEVLGLVGSGPDSATLRIALRTSPAQRDALTRALTEAALGALSAEGLLAGAATPGAA